MSRLTTPKTERNREMICRYEDCDVCEEYCPHLNEDNCPCLQEILEKLGSYEDKEEQGLLIELPCKIGDKAWVIDDDYEYPKKKKVYEAKWIRVSLVQTKLDNSFELRGEVSYQVYDCFYNDGRTMLHGMYVGQESTKVGERVFLTRSEAEEALAKMGGK